MSSVLIAGGSGLVGMRLSHLLKEQGHQVFHLSRKQDLNATFPAYQWDLEKEIIDLEAVQKADYVINLAGASIVGRPWTKARKQLIISSRTQSNKILHQAFSEVENKPKAYLSASAVGYYGNTGDRLAKENSEPGIGFLTESVRRWEESIEVIPASGIRTAIFRIGIVLSTQGGAFAKMFPSYKLYTGAYFGDGQQFYSWIHIDDLCRMFILGMENEDIAGVYNAVGPNPERLKTIAQDIAKAMDKKALIVPVPAAALKLTMGEMSEMLLFSTRVSSQKIEAAGFSFKFPKLVPAIRDVLQRKV